MRRVIAGALAVIAAIVAPWAALAASAASTAPRSLAVSVPADPVPLTPGQTAPVVIRVVNPGAAPVTVTVKQEGVELGDNGRTSFTGAPDPLWSARTDFPPDPFAVPADSYVNVSINVHMPAQISPDLYYVGFVVTPAPTASGSVTVINQIGAFFTIDVAGPRDRKLAADLQVPGFTVGPIHIGSLIVGDMVVGQLTAHNIGPSAIQFFGENDETAAPFSGAPSQQRIASSLLPIGRSRSFQVSAEPGFPIDLVTMTVTLTYPNQTESSTKQIVLTSTMLVISPWLIFVVCGLITLTACWRLAVRRRRRAKRRKARQPIPAPASP